MAADPSMAIKVLIFAIIGALPGNLLASNSVQPSSGCGGKLPKDVTKGSVRSHLLLKVDDPYHPTGKRHFAIYVPNSYELNTPMPLLVDFHGFYDTSRNEAEEDGVAMAAEKEGFIVAYPNGLADNPRDPEDWWNQWNGGGTNGTVAGQYGKRMCMHDHSKYPCYRSCAQAGVCNSGSNRQDCGCSGCADDLGFVAALLRHLSANFCIDETRVHGTGMSNGAIFLYYLATTEEVGPKLASIVPVEGSFLLGFLDAPKVPMPVLDIHGTKDDTVPANVSNSWGKYKWNGCPVEAAGKEGCTVSLDGWFYHPMPEILKTFSVRNKCAIDAAPVGVRTRHDGKTAWSCVLPHGVECQAQVQSCTHNLGHTWPFHEGLHHVRTKEFGEVLWDFMKDKRRESRSGMEEVLV